MIDAKQYTVITAKCYDYNFLHSGKDISHMMCIKKKRYRKIFSNNPDNKIDTGLEYLGQFFFFF